MRRSARTRLLPGALLLALLSGCANAPDSGAPDADTPDAETGQPLRVLAAASLQEVMDPLVQEFTERTGVPVQLSSGGSADLLSQLTQGAPGDLFVPADEPTMERAQDASLIRQDPSVIASNTLVIAVPSGNPGRIGTLADLADPQHALVLCAPQVPCGAVAQQLAQAADVTLAPDSEELAVTDVLGKVRSAEADAGLVYSTDALRAGEEVETIRIEEAAEFPNRYPAAVLAGAEQPELAAEFIELLLSESGQSALEQAGFGPASEASG
ncbi:molybdate ABC transporter substrate-binding protein [Nesterenkonia sp. E16_7]|uniref:molybdate ABC transporter substrate-binding protein n=1 Tax=unclassified Nesterenkonia TaxID=2629769 RepID=UPI001A91CA36|nr:MULTISPECIES: molybdate ABC transporter substrate-binding protein [unclassified Nesterenkonia]MBO0596919.1 molybdate ABC transporter substrate-binding protein [Nesterenkonia sp. E16_10]MBO0598127.1 molybdate ABC transporter substrate-binding protein [Nesterenkonia sp. E16_7]